MSGYELIGQCTRCGGSLTAGHQCTLSPLELSGEQQEALDEIVRAAFSRALIGLLGPSRAETTSLILFSCAPLPDTDEPIVVGGGR